MYARVLYRALLIARIDLRARARIYLFLSCLAQLKLRSNMR